VANEDSTETGGTNMIRCFVVTVVFAIAGAAHAQTISTPAALQAEMMKLQAEMMKAQAAAARPGDEALSCDVLQKEMVASMDHPAIKAYAAKANADAAKQLAEAEKKSAGKKVPMSPAAAAALAAALSPEAAFTGMAAMPTQAQIAQSQQVMFEQMKQQAPLMPMLLRSQRLAMLAMVKNCGWEQ
jgi:hypothetical protein